MYQAPAATPSSKTAIPMKVTGSVLLTSANRLRRTPASARAPTIPPPTSKRATTLRARHSVPPERKHEYFTSNERVVPARLAACLDPKPARAISSPDPEGAAKYRSRLRLGCILLSFLQ